MKKILFTFLLLLSFITFVDAECLDDDLLDYIRNVKLKYKLVDDNKKYDYLYYLYVDPKRDDIELKSTNSLYSGVTNSIDIEGNIGIPSRIHFEEKEYEVQVYVKSTAKNCAGELLTSLKYTVPPYNNYSKTQYCLDNPKLDVCQTMADTSDISNEEFVEIISKPINEKKPLWYRIIFDYLIWILIPALIIGIIYYIRIHNVKKVKENA